MLFRLREDIGLENPEIDHPLMQTGLAPYPSTVPVVTDDLLDRVTEKACREYPELREKIVLSPTQHINETHLPSLRRKSAVKPETTTRKRKRGISKRWDPDQIILDLYDPMTHFHQLGFTPMKYADDKLRDYLLGHEPLSPEMFYQKAVCELKTATQDSLLARRPKSERLSLGVGYWYLSQCVDLVMHDRHPPEYSGTMDFAKGARCLALLLTLGWKERAIAFGRALIQAILSGDCYNASPDYRHCAHWFFIKLFADWQGIDARFEPEQHPAPLYDELLAHWRESDASELVTLLLEACDHHTHECYQTATYPDKQKDFALPLLYAWPIEIHMLFRLREDIGLENPELDHPLMQTGLAPYLPSVPVVTNDRLDRITEKACQEYPELRDKRLQI